MWWRGDAWARAFRVEMGRRVQAAGQDVCSYIYDKLNVQGSIVPLVVSGPWEYPFRQTGELQDSLQVVQGESPLSVLIVSDAIDRHLNIGHHYSAEVELGHEWDGWAWNHETGEKVRVALPHYVEPRPFLWNPHGLYEKAADFYRAVAAPLPILWA